ncbi:hypothetical protein N7490_002660 [Penicillium lividum]|nr:hypothetical protein N7490_002660 [Penicillium lividum]
MKLSLSVLIALASIQSVFGASEESCTKEARRISTQYLGSQYTNDVASQTVWTPRRIIHPGHFYTEDYISDSKG